MTVNLLKYQVQRITILCMFSFVLGVFNQASAIEKIKANSRAVKLIDHFMEALKLKDVTQRESAVIKMLHKSMLTREGKISASVKNYSFKKACDHAHFYQFPVKITEVHKGRVVTIGFKETAERGRIDKYFVAKRQGISGLPAPLHIFWPETGGQPKLVNIGSL